MNMPISRKIGTTLKSNFCAVVDKLIYLKRRIHQKRISLKKVEASEKHVHLLCMKREEYIRPTIDCLNSFWEFNPEYRAVIWIDELISAKANFVIQSLDRRDRVEIRRIPAPNREWQWNKLQIILKFLNDSDFFCDADIIWNGSIKLELAPMFFIREYDLRSRAAFNYLIRTYFPIVATSVFMYNVSIVFLGTLSSNNTFKKECEAFYQICFEAKSDDFLRHNDLPEIRRMCEQIAISVAVSRIGNCTPSVLKESDAVMDGGLAESFYLGATNGF